MARVGAVRNAQLELARASRFGPDPGVVADKRRALAAAKLADYIERTVAAAPPLSEAQLDRLVVLLRGAA